MGTREWNGMEHAHKNRIFILKISIFSAVTRLEQSSSAAREWRNGEQKCAHKGRHVERTKPSEQHSNLKYMAAQQHKWSLGLAKNAIDIKMAEKGKYK